MEFNLKSEAELRQIMKDAEASIIDSKERLRKLIKELASQLPVSKVIEVIEKVSR